MIFLGFGYLFGDLTWTVWTAFAALTGLQLVVTAVIGWCPFHELIKRLGVKDREEVFAEELRGCVRKMFEEGEVAKEVFVAEKRATEQEAFSSERLPAEVAVRGGLGGRWEWLPGKTAAGRGVRRGAE